MSVALRNHVSPWKSFLFELEEYDGFFLFICQFSCSGCIGELCEDFKRYHFFRCSDARVPFCFILLISNYVLKNVWAKTILIGHLHFFIKHRAYAKRWGCLHRFSCSQWLLLEHHNCWYRTSPRLLWVRVQVSREGSVFVLQPGRFGW